MKKGLKIILIILAVTVMLAVLLLAGIKKVFINMLTAPMAPENYTSEIETGGTIEAKYLAMGSHESKLFESDYPNNEDIKTISIWYPAGLETSDQKYPVVLFVNGTGVGASRYKPVFEHMASWGFIAIGNEDPSTFEGKKADATLTYLLEANEDKDSIFYHKIDLENIGVTGHSQGGVGVYNTISNTKHSDLYKCAVPISPTEEEMAAAIQIPYNPANVSIPIFMLCGTESDVISAENMLKNYEKADASKAMAIRIGANHGEMLYSADGYVTAWFRWQLMGDQEAAQVFVGESPELMINTMYQDQRINIQ